MKRCLVFFTVLFFASLLRVNALNIDMVCPRYTVEGSILKCDISYNDLPSVKGLKSDFELTNGLSYVKMNIKDDWDLYSNSSKGFYAANKVAKNNLDAEIEFMVLNNVDSNNDSVFNIKNTITSDGKIENVINDTSVSVNVLEFNEIISSYSVNGKKYDIENGVSVYPVNIYNLNKVDLEFTFKNEDFKLENGSYKITFDGLKEKDNYKTIKVYDNDNYLTEFTFNFIVKYDKKIDNVDNADNNNPRTFDMGIVGISIFILLLSIGALFIIKKLKAGR